MGRSPFTGGHKYMQKAILEPTKTGKGFRVNVKGRIYYATYHEVMMLTYGERKSVVFKDWQEIERAYKARKSQKKVIGKSEG